MADGGIARVCAGRVSVIASLAAAVPALDIDAAARRLDGQYFANLVWHLRSLGHAWGSPAGSCCWSMDPLP
jgi:hypothetical protein